MRITRREVGVVVIAALGGAFLVGDYLTGRSPSDSMPGIGQTDNDGFGAGRFGAGGYGK